MGRSIKQRHPTRQLNQRSLQYHPLIKAHLLRQWQFLACLTILQQFQRAIRYGFILISEKIVIMPQPRTIQGLTQGWLENRVPMEGRRNQKILGCLNRLPSRQHLDSLQQVTRLIRTEILDKGGSSPIIFPATFSVLTKYFSCLRSCVESWFFKIMSLKLGPTRHQFARKRLM